MIWKRHFEIRDKHAFLSPSKGSWLRYDSKKLVENYFSEQSKERGTALHKLAHNFIEESKKSYKFNGTIYRMEYNDQTLNSFVNDVLDANMESEMELYYSQWCFGTADAISYKKKELRIYDLKTGVTPANIDQLKIYAAIWFLQYGKENRCTPKSVNIILRIYQNDEIVEYIPEAEEIMEIMDTIVDFSNIIDETHEKELVK